MGSSWWLISKCIPIGILLVDSVGVAIGVAIGVCLFHFPIWFWIYWEKAPIVDSASVSPSPSWLHFHFYLDCVCLEVRLSVLDSSVSNGDGMEVCILVEENLCDDKLIGN